MHWSVQWWSQCVLSCRNLFKARIRTEKKIKNTLKVWWLVCEPGEGAVNAEVRIEAVDGKGLERLLRYCARPAFASEQLAIRENGHIQFTCQKKSIKGESELILSPDDFLDRVAQLISQPRKHRHRYHEVNPSQPYGRP